MTEEFEKLQEELKRDIINFIVTLKDDFLREANNSPSTILGVKRPGVPNPFSSYMHGKLQQEARENPQYSALSDASYEQVDPTQNNGVRPEVIHGRVVFCVEETYNAATVAFLQTLIGHDPSSLLYATAKPLRLTMVYRKSGV